MTSYDPRKHRPISSGNRDIYTATGNVYSSTSAEDEVTPSAPSFRYTSASAIPSKFNYANMRLSDLEKFPRRNGLDQELRDKGYTYNEDLEAYAPNSEPEVIPPTGQYRDADLREKSQYNRELQDARDIDQREHKLQDIEDMRNVNLQGIEEDARFQRNAALARERGYSRFPKVRGVIQKLDRYPRPQRTTSTRTLGDLVRDKQAAQSYEVEHEQSSPRPVYDPLTGRPVYDPLTGKPMTRQISSPQFRTGNGPIGVRLPSGFTTNFGQNNAEFRVPSGSFSIPSSQFRSTQGSAWRQNRQMPLPQLPQNIQRPGQYLGNLMPRGINVGFQNMFQRRASSIQPARFSPQQVPEVEDIGVELGYKTLGRGKIKVIRGNPVGVTGRTPVRKTEKKGGSKQQLRFNEIQRPQPASEIQAMPMQNRFSNSFTWRLPSFNSGHGSDQSQSVSRERPPGFHVAEGIFGRHGQSSPETIGSTQLESSSTSRVDGFSQKLRGLWFK